MDDPRGTAGTAPPTTRFGSDDYNRTVTAKSNMFDNKPTETQYVYTDDDSDGVRLDGNTGTR
jgi:hypothetical protein